MGQYRSGEFACTSFSPNLHRIAWFQLTITGGGGGSRDLDPLPPGFNPLPPPNFLLPTPAPFFSLFFFRVPPPKIQIFGECPRPISPPTPAHFSPKAPPTPAPLTPGPPTPLSSPTLQWRQNERDGISNHWCFDWLLNHLFRRGSKKTPTLRVIGLCEGNPPVTGGIPHTKGQ